MREGMEGLLELPEELSEAAGAKAYSDQAYPNILGETRCG